MAVTGFSESLADRGLQTDTRVLKAATAGAVFMLGSVANWAQLASDAAMWVLDRDVTADGVVATDVVMGVEVRETKVGEPAFLRPLATGDTFRTNFLASGSETGAILGTSAPNSLLAVDPAQTGKIRLKQAADKELFRIASDGGNTFDTDGYIWVEVVRLA